MSRWKTFSALTIAATLGFIVAAPASAQVWVAGPPILVPNIAPPFSPPSSYSVVNSYPAPSVFAPTPVYGAYRPVVVPAVAPPVFNPVGAVAPTRYRPAVVAPGIGGLPNIYVPGQPIRNVLRYALP